MRREICLFFPPCLSVSLSLIHSLSQLPTFTSCQDLVSKMDSESLQSLLSATTKYSLSGLNARPCVVAFGWRMYDAVLFTNDHTVT